MLDISYQAARNYLAGRYPDAAVLITISDRTPYSINWLLTGKGGKFALNDEKSISLSEDVRAAIRLECKSVITNLLSSKNDEDVERVLVLKRDKILDESLREDGEPIAVESP